MFLTLCTAYLAILVLPVESRKLEATLRQPSVVRKVAISALGEANSNRLLSSSLDTIDTSMAPSGSLNTYLDSSMSHETWSKTFVANLLATANTAGPTAAEKERARKYFYDSHPSFYNDGHLDAAALQLEARTLTQTAIDALPDATEVLHGDFEAGGPQTQGDADVLAGGESGWSSLIQWFDAHKEGVPLVKIGFADYVPNVSKRHGVEEPYVYHGADYKYLLGKKWIEAQSRMIGRKFTLVAGGNDNWGFLSTWYPNRTVNWRRWTSQLSEMINTFLDSPEVNLLFHEQHFNFTHPKIVPLPLSTRKAGRIDDPIYDELRRPEAKDPKTGWLGMFSTVGRGRFKIYNDLRAKFGDQLVTLKELAKQTNSHKRMDPKQYFAAVRSNRFQMCPSGLGYDCYCIWEAIRVGAIPVVERGWGFDRLFSQLPVLMLDDYGDMSMGFLQAIYPFYIKHAREFLWKSQEHKFWVQKMRTSTLQSAAKDFPFPTLPQMIRQPCLPGNRVSHVHCSGEESGRTRSCVACTA